MDTQVGANTREDERYADAERRGPPSEKLDQEEREVSCYEMEQMEEGGREIPWSFVKGWVVRRW